MSNQITVRRLTGDDLLEVPSGQAERYELIEGEVVVMAPAGGEYGLVAGRLLGLIFGYLEQHPLGEVLTAETGFYTRGDKHTVRAPDVAFIPHERIPESGMPKGYLDIVPTLVAEVVSPHDKADAVEQKIGEWLAFGVALVWVVYPASRRVYVYRQDETSPTVLTVDDTLDGETVLPGFTLAVKRLFQK